MTDYTAEITRLQRARLDMQNAKETARITVKNRYAERIAAEIEYETNEAEREFARLLKEAHERGVPSTLLRSEVLRTNVWSRWTYWRDRAGITPDRVVQEDRRKAEAKANAHFLWHDTTSPYTFDVVKDASGLTVTPVPAKVEAATPKDWQGKEDFFAEVARGDYPEFGGFLAFQRYVNAEVKRAFEAGEIPEIISEYDALQRAKKNNA